MRLSHLLLAALLALAGPVRAADNTLERVLELSGVKLLCEQTAPLLQRGMQAEQQKALGQAFAAAPLCRDLAAKVAKQVKREQLDAAPWDAAEAERVIDEVLLAYRFNTDLFADLAAAKSTPAA